MSTIIEIIGAIIGGLLIVGGTLNMSDGHSGIGILYGFIVMFVAFRIGDYYKWILRFINFS